MHGTCRRRAVQSTGWQAATITCSAGAKRVAYGQRWRANVQALIELSRSPKLRDLCPPHATPQDRGARGPIAAAVLVPLIVFVSGRFIGLFVAWPSGCSSSFLLAAPIPPDGAHSPA
jgi:hypothetical protein